MKSLILFLLIVSGVKPQASSGLEIKSLKGCLKESAPRSSQQPAACGLDPFELSQILNLKPEIVNQLHAIHVSVSEISYSEKDKALQITSRIFIDDLELAIRAKLNSPELDLLKPSNGQTIDHIVSGYLSDHLKFKLDNKTVKIHYLGHEIDDLAIVCYIEIEGVKKFKSLEVLNNVIQEIHYDQSNLVHITYKGPVKSFRLTKEKPADIFKIQTK